MKFRFRSAALIAAIAAIIATVLTAVGGAAAETGPADPALNPQTTNVPYVAWAGEQLRFVKCYSAADLEDAGIRSGAPLIAHYNVVNPRIDAASSIHPTWEGGGALVGAGNITFPNEGGLCASGTYYSEQPGLADILLNVTDLSGTTTVLPKHDFLGIWLQMNRPTIREAAGGGDNGTGAFNLGSNAGRPVVPGIVQVNVTGTFPFAGRTWTFPGTTEWSDLAHMLATDTNPRNVSPGDAFYRWDIHDNNGLDEGHPFTPCTTNGITALPPGVLDAVDNCNGGTAYSRIAGYDYADGSAIGDVGGSDVGPFDPLFSETLLGNGQLDAFDVPMPAAQINLTMAGNVGGLQAASKQMLYSRNGTGAPTAHNLYAPYYSQYIPATSRPGFSSGVDGPQNINDVAGFQTYGLYPNWNVLNGVGATGVNNCLTASGGTIPLPGTGSGTYLSGTVYTDENGMADVLFNPNGGFNLVADANNRCAAFVVGPTTYTSTINATAVYPYKKVGPAQTAAAPLTKTVTTAALKSLSCQPKSLYEAFCVETIHDIWGNPVRNAQVRFLANSTGNVQIQPDAAALGTFDTRGQYVDATNPAANFVVLRTNSLGEAGVALTDSLAADCVNLRAENLGTSVNGNPGVSVFTDFNPATGAACNAGPVTAPGGGSTATQPPGSQGIGGPLPVTNTEAPKTNSNTTSSSNATVSAPTTGGVAGSTTAVNGTPSVVAATSHKAASVTIRTARFITVGGVRYLGLQLTSTDKSAKVNITLVGKNGKVIGHVIKLVPTGKMVRVMKVNAGVKTVRVATITA